MQNDVTAFAPATVANVGIGFDILGHTVEAVGDRVRLGASTSRWCASARSPGSPANCRSTRSAIPPAARCRPCTAALELELRLRDRRSTRASRSAPAWAARPPPRSRRWSRPTRCSSAPLPPLRLLKFAMEGEIVASGSAHVDNIAPCLFGGLVLTVGIDHPRVKQIPVPALAALRARASAHASRHARGARGAQERRDALRFRLADARISRGSSAAATRTIST